MIQPRLRAFAFAAVVAVTSDFFVGYYVSTVFATLIGGTFGAVAYVAPRQEQSET